MNRHRVIAFIISFASIVQITRGDERATTAPAQRSADVRRAFVLDAPTLWARPIDDYIEVAKRSLNHDRLIRTIGDLVVFDDHLYFAYGDGNVNLGRIKPLEIRAFATDDPDSLRSEFVTDEEKIDHFRATDEALFLPGFDDARDRGGTVYRKREGNWSRSETFEQAMHLHDVAITSNAIYACGSGGTREEFARGDVHALVYRSDDDGASFQLLDRLPNPSAPGDNRFTNLLSIDDRIYLFGYQTDRARNLTATTCRMLESDRLELSDLLSNVIVEWTINLSPSSGLITGVARDHGMRYALWHVDADGAHRIEALDDRRCLDAIAIKGGRALLLTLDGNGYPTPLDARIARVSLLDGDHVSDLLRVEGTPRPMSIAWWKGALYLGMEDGSIRRSVPRVNTE